MSLSFIFTKKKINVNALIRTLQMYYRNFSNHYDTLKLKRNCSSKEIKESFIQLSKQNHPDVNKSKEAHERFVKITEAYQVLSKPESRRNYDMGFPVNGSNSRRHYNEYDNYSRDAWSDPTFYYNRRKANEPFDERQPYYGIKGVKKVSNGTIALLCFLFATLGLILQGLAVRYSFTFHRNQLVKQSEEAEELLSEARARARANGNQMQIELFKLKYEMAQAAKNKPKDI